MAVRFRNEFFSLEGLKWTVEISDADFSGTVFDFNSGADGFSMQFQGDARDTSVVTMPTAVEFTFYMQSPTHHNILNDIVEGAEGRFTVGIYRGMTPELFWAGTILPEVSNVEDRDFPQAFRIKAVDGLGMLAKIDYLDDGDPYTGLARHIDIIAICLKKIGHVPTYFAAADPFLVTAVNSYDTLDTITATADPLSTKYVAQEVYVTWNTNGGFKAKNCLEVLTAILRPHLARIVLSDGVWRIEQRETRAFADDSHWRQYDYAVGSPSAHTPDADQAGNPVRPRLAGGTESYLPALQKVRVTQVIGALRNVIQGDVFDHDHPGAYTHSVYTDGTASTLALHGAVEWKITNLGITSPFGLTWPYVIVFEFTIKLGDKWLRRSESVLNNGTVKSVYKWSPIAASMEFSTKVIYPFVDIGEETHDTTTFDNSIFEIDEDLTGEQPLEISFGVARFIRLAGNTGITQDPADYDIEWKLLNPYLTVTGEPVDKADKFYKEAKVYEAVNPNATNTEVLEVELLVGDAEELNMLGAIRHFDGVDYLATTDWGQRAAGGEGKIAELVAARLLAAQMVPTLTYQGEVTGDAAYKFVHVLRTEDFGRQWYFADGSYTAATDTIAGTWHNLVYSDEAVIIVNPPYEPGTYERHAPPPPGLNGTGKGYGTDLQSVGQLVTGFMAFAYTAEAMDAGAVTEFEINEPLEQFGLVAGDLITVVHPGNLQGVDFLVTDDAAVGDTVIQATGTIPEDGFPANSFVVYRWQNFIAEGGSHAPIDGGAGSGTLINFSSGDLTPLFTTSVSDPTTSPHQTFNLSNAAAGTYFGSIVGGAPVFETAGAISRVDDTNVTISLSGGYAKALLKDATITLGWTGVLAVSRGGTGLGSLGSSLQLIRVNSAGTALEYFTATFLTGNETITLSGDVTGSGATSIATTIANNVVSNAKLRDSAALSVIGRASNSTGDPGDIVAGTDAFVLLRSGTSLVFAQIVTASITDDAVTNPKLANMAQNTVKGRVSSGTGDPEDLTASQLATLLGYTGTATRILYWGASNTIASDGNLTRDATNNRVTITGTVAATGANNAWLNLNGGSISGNTEALRLSATILGELIAHITNASNTSTAAAVMRLTVGGTSAADPFLHLVVTSGNQVAIGIDNSDADKFKISPGSATPGATANKGVIITQDAATRVGINNDAPSYELDVFGTTRTQVLAGRVGTPSISYGTGAGTGPTTNFCTGGSVTVSLSFTTGTSPAAAGADIFTITIPYAAPLDCGPAWGVRNANAAGIRWYCPTSGTSTFTIRALDTLAASTNYQMKFIIASPTGA